MKRIVSLFLLSLVFVGSLSSLASCGREKGVTVRYLNFKPEVAEKYTAIAKEYEKETGVRVIVETAAANTYEQTLLSKLPTREAPTIFQINGAQSYAAYKDYLSDLSKTGLYAHLSDKDLALQKDGKVYGIPYVVEGYGIICNRRILDKYFALPSKETSYTSIDEITDFAAFSAIVRDMQKQKSALGIEGDEFTLNFSVTDNVHDEDDQAEKGNVNYLYTRFSGDILDFYTSGDVAPGGRFKYSYRSLAAEMEVDPETAPETEEEKSTGCGAFAAAPLAAIIPAAAVISKKRKNKNK